jgi:hypothetical protein
MLVCGIELDMLVPTVEKKLLKALDISKLSVVEAPFIDISYSIRPRYSTFKHFRSCSACDEIGSQYAQHAMKLL